MDESKNKEKQLDLLHGNICRISVTDDIEELKRMVFFANLRIFYLYEIKKEEIINKHKNENLFKK